ncbi:MAG: c-type cytochrome [Pseudomonadota bacterium]|nr:c-type cytochrome [Pseudomonadota bacterium]
MTIGPGAATALALTVAVGGCKAPSEQRYLPDPAAVARGHRAIESAGCAACHRFDGIDWPRGRIGPSLTNYDDRGWIAGSLPYTPENLAAFVRNAPAVKPGSTMPAMPVSAAQSRDIAAFLMASDHD